MPAEDNSTGWILHSHGQGRKFGPLNEDELRSYFRAGMVKSVDRLSAPGDDTRLAAADVATMLGEAVPVGPPPPEPSVAPAAPPPRPVATATLDPGVSNEERAARAAAAMNIDLTALMASNAPVQKRSSSGWIWPTLAVVGLIAALFMGLNMMRKIKPGHAPAGPDKVEVVVEGAQDGQQALVPDAPGTSGTRNAQVPVADGSAPVAEAAEEGGTQDPLFSTRFAQAEAMKNANDWPSLATHAKSWSEAQPELDEPLHFLGMANAMMGKYADAEVAFRKVLARSPDDAGVRSLLADTYLQEKKFEEAVTLYKDMVVATPSDSRLWNNYGAALNGAGQPAQAAAALENAVRLDPSFKQAWTNLGNLYQSQGDTARASAAFANAR
jgi:Flp pilus assembly protein TadD